MNVASALQSIREVVGPRGLVDDSDAATYLTDQRRLYNGEAALIVRPATTDEVAWVLRICNEAGLGVVPQGGNTGYCGGATPDDGSNQVLVCLGRLNRVRAIDKVGMTMTVEAGMVLARAQQEAEAHDLLFPLSMGSEGSCQVGGVLSTNAGGLAVLRYGTARDLVLGLEVVLPDGRVVDGLTGLRKDNTGYDLKSLFVGAEGTLGIITAAVLKLFPRPRSQQTAWIAMDSADSVCRLLSRARRTSGDSVTSFEYITRGSLELVVEQIDDASDPLDQRYEHYVLIELSSPQDEEGSRAMIEALLMEGMERGDIVDGTIAESGQQRDKLWRLRESVPEAERHRGQVIKHDISVTIDRIPEFLAAAPDRLAAIAPCLLSIYGHIGDGNLHYNLLPTDPAKPFANNTASALADAIHALAVELGGSFSAEHGVGKLKKDALARFKDPAALDTMRLIKNALDPRGLMNPGKLL
ncbi:MAG: FAD-binding oxidoreductase [Gammaproteobacteria bacterium]|nr:FAD-binding oxidoreductase [Gammaproteobacteria bacterium]